MSKNTAILTIGTLSLLMPFLGFPTTWKNFFDVAFGIVLITLSFSVAIKRRSSVKKSVRRKKDGLNPMFVDGIGNGESEISSSNPSRGSSKSISDTVSTDL